MTAREYTVTEAAAVLGRAPVTVRQLAERHGRGRLVNPRLRLLTAADIEFMRALKPGRPPRQREQLHGDQPPASP